jgi:tRNA 2-thiouridine synthesizing protein D
MIFSILVCSGPYSTLGSSHSALKFTSALLSQGHKIHQLFFYGDGIHNVNASTICPQDEFDLCQAWQSLILENQLNSIVCIAAAVRRGVLDDRESRRHQRGTNNLQGGSELGGLGQLIEAAAVSDRLITFA